MIDRSNSLRVADYMSEFDSRIDDRGCFFNVTLLLTVLIVRTSYCTYCRVFLPALRTPLVEQDGSNKFNRLSNLRAVTYNVLFPHHTAGRNHRRCYGIRSNYTG